MVFYSNNLAKNAFWRAQSAFGRAMARWWCQTFSRFFKFYPSSPSICAFLFFSLFSSFHWLISAAWLTPFRCVKVRSLYLSGMCGRSIILNVLSFIQIDPSFIMYWTHHYCTLLCLWHANGRRPEHATTFAFFHSIQSSICIHDILP